MGRALSCRKPRRANSTPPNKKCLSNDAKPYRSGRFFGFSRRSGRKRIKTFSAQVAGLAGPQVSGGQISRGTVWRRSGFEAGEFDAFRNVVAELELELFHDAASGRG